MRWFYDFAAGCLAAGAVFAVGQIGFGVRPTLGEVLVVAFACAACRAVSEVFFPKPE